MRMLYVHATLVPPPTDLKTDRFFLLSEHLEGDVLQPVWFRKPEEVEAVFGPGSYPVYTAGRFRYHWFLAWRHKGVLRQRLAIFWFYVRKGMELHRKQPFDCILAYSHMTTGLCAGLLKVLGRQINPRNRDGTRVDLSHDASKAFMDGQVNACLL